MTGDLFGEGGEKAQAARAPLAERMRPATLDEVVGQDHLLAPDKLLTQMVAGGSLRSIILWGPPGTGKTTIARLLAAAADTELVALSAVLSGVKDIRAAIETARHSWDHHARATALFVDEIHRFNKAQQDALLPHVEAGTVTLIGATTENPSFEVNSALLSRARVLVLEPLSIAALERLLDRALGDVARGLGAFKLELDAQARTALLESSGADARRMLGTLEVAADLATDGRVSLAQVEQAMQSKWIHHDAGGDAHFDVVSALIKSLRDSDADAALYWCARMLEAGEDPMYIARRLVILAAEDVGMADPQALVLVNAVKDAVHFTGMPEARIPLALACTYLAEAPKSNAAYKAMDAAIADVRQFGALPVPAVMRNAPTDLMKQLGHGAGYVYAHDDADGAAAQAHLPERLADRRYYQPGTNGLERWIGERRKSSGDRD